MDHEAVLLESRTMRGSLAEYTESLDRAKVFRLLPDGVHLTRSLLADYFEVDEEAIRSLVRRHREELSQSGMALLKGADLQELPGVDTAPGNSPGRGLLVFPRRAVLNVAMLLRDSEVARQVRRHLLDAVEGRGRWSAAVVADIAERAAAGARADLAELREAYARLVGQLEAERALIAATSVRIADTAGDVHTLGGRVDMLCTLGAAPCRGGRRRRGRWQ
ncbi:hypothetical protein [Kitasatospora sp. GP82]|uniref:hypothetical protein n=1 Tax=Kitasatospora sp. GP82 TaxID=3035089 RepID=UPI00247479AC|nr:hypothetical protein [Kitasatospora sp. GP82]MDH6127628.1 hypothetical protein [Kitasatospora sp. GP82]